MESGSLAKIGLVSVFQVCKKCEVCPALSEKKVSSIMLPPGPGKCLEMLTRIMISVTPLFLVLAYSIG